MVQGDSMLLQSGSCAWKVRRHHSTPRGCPRRGSGVAARRGAAAAQPRRAGCPAPGHPKPQTLPPLQLPRTANGKAYAAVSRAVSAHAPRLAAKDAQFSGACNEPGFRPIGARGAEPRVLQRARGDRARMLVLGEYELWRSSVCFRRMPIIASLKRLQI